MAPFCDQGDPLYEVKKLCSESTDLKETLEEPLMENRLLTKSVLGDGENDRGDSSYRFVIDTNTTRHGTPPIIEYGHSQTKFRFSGCATFWVRAARWPTAVLG